MERMCARTVLLPRHFLPVQTIPWGAAENWMVGPPSGGLCSAFDNAVHD